MLRFSGSESGSDDGSGVGSTVYEVPSVVYVVVEVGIVHS